MFQISLFVLQVVFQQNSGEKNLACNDSYKSTFSTLSISIHMYSNCVEIYVICFECFVQLH